MSKFIDIFSNQRTKEMGVKLKGIIESQLDNIEENIVGGAKVKLALYSRNGSSNVLCGIQEGKDESCMLYVHHIDSIDHDRLAFSGSGKHAKRIRFNSINEIIEDDIKWILAKVEENAPY